MKLSGSGVRLAVLLTLTATAATAQPPAEQRYAELCSPCHGDRAGGTDRGPALVKSRRLRVRSAAEIREIIRNGTPAGMPPFALPEGELDMLAALVRSLNGTAYDARPAGDTAAGERFFFGKGQCGSCHMVLGRGKASGPDLSAIGRQLTLAELEKALVDPSVQIADGYAVVNVRLRDGSIVRGFARHEGARDLQLQTPEGRLYLLLENEYQIVSRHKASLMPPLQATGQERRDLLAWLSTLAGARPGAIAGAAETIPREAIEHIHYPRPGEWPTYHGSMSGNRHSALDQINAQNVSRLALAWTYTIPYFGLEMTPLVADGVMYVSGPNQVYALDPGT